MHKTALRLVQEFKEIPLAVQCNKCGVTFEYDDDHQEDCEEAQEFHDFCIPGRFLQSAQEDRPSFKWVMCTSCVKDLVESFSIPAESEHVTLIRAIDATSKLPVEVSYGLAYPRGGSKEDYDVYTYEVIEKINSFEWPPIGVFRHHKGGLYKTVGACLWAPTMEPMVLYRALYGESQSWIRPLSEWDDDIGSEEKENLRFTEVSWEKGPA